MGINSIRIKKYKSIRDSGVIEIKSLNVLIGPNGAGKSNFISFFKFLNRLYNQNLQLYINTNGRSDNFLYFGQKVSDSLEGIITFNNDWKNEYEFKMIPNQNGNLIFEYEYSNYLKPGGTKINKTQISNSGLSESFLKESSSWRNKYLREQFTSFKIFHFHDTSFSSKVKQPSNSLDYAFLREDAGNLAAFLYMLQEAHPSSFRMIERVVQSIAPFFDKFYLESDEISPDQIFLRWFEKGSDQIFNAHNLSDGTLRMICLATLLLQPNLPSVIIIDEPELGLHPFAISKLAALIKSASVLSQIIISTQSVSLIDYFEANDIIVVEREDNQTVFKRQDQEALQLWLNDYTLGEIWNKNIIGGRPR